MSRARAVLLSLVCVAGLVGLLAGCGGDSETVTVVETAPAETTAPEVDDSAVGEDDTIEEGEQEPEVSAPTSFQTPSGNIACGLSDGGVRCDISDRVWSAPRPKGCPPESDYGQGLTVSEDGPGSVVCAGDSLFGPDQDVLGYGQSLSVGDFTCTSEEDGVTCRDDGDNRGFFISKQAYRLF